jgi:hypothetical protein
MPPEKRRRANTRKPERPENPEIKALKEEVDRLKILVRKHNDILQVQDNWHNRVSKLIGKKVNVKIGGEEEWLHGILLWTDRYNIGLRTGTAHGLVDIEPVDEIVNKGHIARIQPAE